MTNRPVKTAAIYARFSTELQDSRSIEDQVALCHQHAGKLGLSIVESYADYAVSGASVHGRFAFERMVADAKRGAFDIILAEDLDRLSRNQADIAGLYERMRFVGVDLVTVADGEINEMHIGLKGTMSALFLRTLALKVHRGQAGRVRAGKIPGGLCYGYRVSGTGERELVTVEAEIIRRIFRDTVSGLTARTIAAGLNREGVPAPQGGLWNASTINGSRKRRNGILRQPLYVGRLMWNRQRMVKNPDTGKRVTRVNGDDALMHADVPQLRIVDDETWTAVQEILARRGGPHAVPARKSPRIFSGLIKCGGCGRSYVSRGGVGNYVKLACSGRIETGACDNARSVSAVMIEEKVLAAIETHLLDEQVIEGVVAEYVAERRRIAAARARESRARDKRLAEIARASERLWRAIEDGVGDSRTAGDRIKTLAAERAELEAQDEAAPVIALHPGVASRYRIMIAGLRANLGALDEVGRAEILRQVRELVQRIVIYPHGDVEGRDIELVGELAGFLGPGAPVYRGKAVVAEERIILRPPMSCALLVPIRSRA